MPIAEYNGSTLLTEYVYFGSQLVATLDVSGNPTYHHRDHLSVRMRTDSSGNVLAYQGHYPFGETWHNTGSAHKWMFTSYERDSESGNDYALHRFDATRLGRFTTPDPIRGRISNPQRLNRYAYTMDDPMNRTDPSGLDDGTYFTFGDLGGVMLGTSSDNPYNPGFLGSVDVGGFGGDMLALCPMTPPWNPDAPVGGGKLDDNCASVSDGSGVIADSFIDALAAAFCPGTTDCTYYNGQCRRANGENRGSDKVFYYCTLAPNICKNTPNNFFANCVRLCLQTEDQKQNCMESKDIWECDTKTHETCLKQCFPCAFSFF